jgi:hypothetical protein
MRTVKKAIEDMRGRLAAQEAMAQLYRDAFHGHIDQLNSALDSIIEGLRIPGPYFSELAWKEITVSKAASQENKEAGEKGVKNTEQIDDVFSERALIAEHLKNSKAWRALSDWTRSLRKHRTACGLLQMRSFEVLKELTGLNAYEQRDVVAGPFIHAENAGDLLCRVALKYLSVEYDTEAVAKEITVNDESRAVVHYTTVLAEGFEDTRKASECRTNIVKSLEMLKESTEARQVLMTFQQLGKLMPKVRNELLAVRLLGVLPGQCRICRQFGL